MMQRFFLTLLCGAVLFAGCESDDDKSPVPQNQQCPSGNCQSVSSCGNGVLDTGEACDASVQSGAKFANNVGDCAAYDNKYESGALSCTNQCTIDTKACVLKTQGKCGNGALDTGEACDSSVTSGAKFANNVQNCADCNSKYESGALSCTGCVVDTKACVLRQDTGATHSTNFDWLKCEEKTANKQSRYDTTFQDQGDNYTIVVTGRCNLQEDKVTSVLDFSIDGAGILLNTTKEPKSSIVVTVTSGGIGTVSVDVRTWDAGYAYVELPNGTLVYHNGNATPDTVPEDTQTRLVFPIFDKNVSTFTLKTNHNDLEHPDYRARLTLDNLTWTEAE